MVDVAADYPVHAPLPGGVDDRGLEVAHVLHRLFHLLLQIGGERPVAEAQPPPGDVEPAVEPQQQVVGAAAQVGQPLVVHHHAVELVPVQDQKASAVRGLVHRLLAHVDAGEVEAEVVAEEFVVVAGHVDHPGAPLRLVEHQADDLVVDGRPVPARLHLPHIEDVAHQIEGIAFVMFEEVEEVFGSGGSEAKVGIG